MLSNEELVLRLTDQISERVTQDLRESIMQTVEREVQRNISKALVEGEFFRGLSQDLHAGLKSIYREISQAKQDDGSFCLTRDKADELLSEASDQLDQIMRTTEEATVEIMDVVEKHLELQATSATLIESLSNGGLKEDGIRRLANANTELGQDLMRIMTTLGFQDLTGQRIKKIVQALRQVERITFDLFMSTGLKIKAHEKEPDPEPEMQDATSELKGPQEEANQQDVDDLLSQLGLE